MFEQRRVPKGLLSVVLTLVLLASVAAAAVAQGTEVVIRTPILVTSEGQSPDVLMVRVLLNRIGVENITDELAEPAQLEGVQTVIFALGGSQKGLGAAGIDPEQELARIERVLKAAEERGLTIIGVHIGGEGRRGPLSERFIIAAAPRTHYLIVTEDGNRDGYFTRLAQERGIGLTVVSNTLEVGPVIQAMLER